MTQPLIISQHDDTVNAKLRERLPEYAIQTIEPGVPRNIPVEGRILLTRPFVKPGSIEQPPRPEGWPFNLEWVHLTSSGIDAYPDWLFDVPKVTSARGTSAIAVAEFALAAVFAEAKGFPQLWIDNVDSWKPTPLKLLQGSTLGIVGFGAIGSALASRAVALGLRVIALNHSGKPFDVPGVVAATSLPALFAESDHVVLAAPATAATRHLVNRELLAHAKPGLHLVNIARGSLIDEDALLVALDNGQLGTATLDVTQVEPAPAGHPFYRHPRVRLSPHVSPSTASTWVNIVDQFVDNLRRFHLGEPLPHRVDFSRGY